VSPAKAKPAKSRAKSGTAGAGTTGSGTTTASPLPAVNLEQLALRPRPEPAPEALAVIAAAAQLLWTRPAAPEAPHPAHDGWRFSGRWWAQPALVRRSRPWARP
jgi:hypothetical protein